MLAESEYPAWLAEPVHLHLDEILFSLRIIGIDEVAAAARVAAPQLRCAVTDALLHRHGIERDGTRCEGASRTPINPAARLWLLGVSIYPEGLKHCEKRVKRKMNETNVGRERVNEKR